jgi:hypothetical protein
VPILLSIEPSKLAAEMLVFLHAAVRQRNGFSDENDGQSDDAHF